MVEDSVIVEAGRLLTAAAPHAEVILFGSYARGDAGPDSDLDFLVVTPDAGDRHREMVRLARVLRPLGAPVDVIVVSRAQLADWVGVDGSMLHAAVTEGRVLSGSA
jgi:predicted nucleotidyltransferase